MRALIVALLVVGCSGEARVSTEPRPERAHTDTDGSPVYAYDYESESLVETGHEVRDGELILLDERARLEDLEWSIVLPCPPAEGTVSISAAGTVLYRLSPEEYAEACERH